MFTSEISEVGCDELPLLSVFNDPPRVKGLQLVEASMKCFATATMFCERGIFSEHLYQPSVNHRQLNLGSYVTSTPVHNESDIPPLLNSMIYPTPSATFSGAFPMRLFGYEVVEAEGERDLISASPMTYRGKTVTGPPPSKVLDKDGKIFLENGYAKDSQANFLTVEGFERTLRVFNLNRNVLYEASPTVHAHELASFLVELGRVPMGTIDGLNEFVKAFKLDRFYSLTTEALPEQQKKLFAAIRMLCPLRFAAYDGRHRYALCCYFATGRFFPTQDMTPNTKSFEEVAMEMRAGADDDAIVPTYGDCQLFLGQRVVFALSDTKVCTTFADACEVLVNQGIIAAGSQRLYVKPDWRHLISETVTAFMKTELFRNRVAFDHRFWLETDPALPYAVDAPFIMGFAAQGPTSRMPLVVKDSPLSYERITQLCVHSPGFTYPLGYKEDGKPPSKVPKPIGTFLALIKLISHDPASWVILRNFVEQTHWRLPQLPLTEKDERVLRSLDVLRQFIMQPVASAAAYVSQKYVVERFIMEFARKAVNNPSIANDLANFGGLCFPVTAQSAFKFRGFVDPTNVIEGKLDHDSNGRSPNAKLTTKLKYACHATLMKDALSTINDIGFNPLIRRTDTANHAAELYLR